MPTNTFYILNGNASNTTAGEELETKNMADMTLDKYIGKASQGMKTLKTIGAITLVKQGVSVGKSLISYQISNYGLRTGDTIGQQKINNNLEMLSQIGGIGASVGSGFLVGGVAGAVVGAIVSVSNIAVNQYKSTASYKLTIARANATAEYQSELLGDILTGGSR